MPVFAFGKTYLIGMTLLLALTRTWPAVVALAFLWPAMLLPGVTGWPEMVIIAAVVIVITWGHRQCLRSFPWHPMSNANQFNAAAGGKSALNTDIRIPGLEGEPYYMGWPYLMLSPKFNRKPVTTTTSLCLSALAGWWTYCFIKCTDMEVEPGLVLVIAVGAGLVRLAIYCGKVAPPFNVLGRLASGRILLQGFDQVFLAPLAAILIGVGGGMIIQRSGGWYPVAESGTIALVGCVLLTGGPTLRDWMLTGRLRFRTPSAKNASGQRLRRV